MRRRHHRPLKWCAVHYPSVTEATWQKVVNLDYENGVITTDFKLNDTNSVSVTCVYEQSTGRVLLRGLGSIAMQAERNLYE